MTAIAPLRWGILGTSHIAEKVIPAMQKSALARIDAIGSRDIARARTVAGRLGIPRAYGSYDEVIADAQIDAIYNPLPNHLHVPWSMRAAEAGKHVLCEKPIALSAEEAEQLRAVRDKHGVQIAEAFMVRAHPQWEAVRALITSGRIGELRLVSGHFSYYRRDPADIRSRSEWGGGALMDIGCYPIVIARWMFDAEPVEVIGMIETDPDLRIDRLTSGLLRFDAGHATFTCAGQLVPHQRVQLFGTTGRIEVEIPFNAPDDRPARLLIDNGSALGGRSAEVIEVETGDQYTLQAERFAAAVQGTGELPMSLESSVLNMQVIDALFRSAKYHAWEQVGPGAGSAAPR